MLETKMGAGIRLSICCQILFFVLMSLPTWAGEYENSDLHYHFLLPPGWIEIPNEVIEESTKTLSGQVSLKVPRFIAGFQKSSDKYFVHPYALVEHLPPPKATFSQIATRFGEREMTEAVTKIEYDKLIRDVRAGKTVIDHERKMILINIEQDIAEIGTIKSLTALFSGQDGIVEIHFYTLKEDYESHLPTFMSVIDSFGFESGFEDDRGLPEHVSSRSTGFQIVKSILIGAVAGLAAYCLIIAIRKARRKKGEGTA